MMTDIHVVPSVADLFLILERLNVQPGDYLVFPNGAVEYVVQVTIERRVGYDDPVWSVKRHSVGWLAELQKVVEQAPGLIAKWKQEQGFIDEISKLVDDD